MGLRFRKSFKVAPGVKVNLNKKSTSVTFGGKGVHKTFQNNVAGGSSASLDKFTTDSLKRYKITSAILSAFLFFVALIGFAGGSALATVICLIFGGITLAISITYSKEIKKRLSSESSFGSSTFSGTSPDIELSFFSSL